jgi:hypothetical protein
MVVAALHAATRDDPQDAHAVYDLLRFLTFALDIPLAIVTLLSGLTLALTSAWRIFGDRWLTTKLALYLATVTLGVAVLGPSIDTMLDVTETSSPGRARCGGSPSNCPPRRPRCCSQPQRSACSSPAEARAGGSLGHEGSRMTNPDLWAIAMLISGGLFAGGVASIAWERLPAWRATELADFRVAFAHTLRRVDRLQPALLVVCLVATIGFAFNVDGASQLLALLAAASFLAVLVGSGALLVPVQRRLVSSSPELPSREAERLRSDKVTSSSGRAQGEVRLPRRSEIPRRRPRPGTKRVRQLGHGRARASTVRDVKQAGLQREHARVCPRVPARPSLVFPS